MASIHHAPDFLSPFARGLDGVYGAPNTSTDQEAERAFRAAIAARSYPNLLDEIARHHSIPVMDKEVEHFLRNIPPGGVVLDVGGCWGWHWRSLGSIRSDVTLCIVDLIRENFTHARRILGDQIDRNVFLVHGDATALDFPTQSFDAYWSVQALQHVPNFSAAIDEAHRVLRPGGLFACYSLNDAMLVRSLYRLAGRHYHRRGHIEGAFYLERMSEQQIETVKKRFGNDIQQRFTELLFNPDLSLTQSGAAGSIWGRMDAGLSGGGWWRKLIAHQHSVHALR